jgi:hypothetical protein
VLGARYSAFEKVISARGSCACANANRPSRHADMGQAQSSNPSSGLTSAEKSHWAIITPPTKRKRATVNQNSKPKCFLAISGSGDRV